MNLYETEEKVQRFVLAAVENPQAELPIEDSLDELADLLRTAGGEEAGRIIQKREAPQIKSYLGSGKLEELKAAVELWQADGVITDDELTPVQLRSMAEAAGVKVIDRTLLILDIFSQRAATREGQLQVEMAQLSYRLSHLTGLGTELSRQGGAVGGGAVHSRGAGETKLELDRRHIRERMDQLRRELKKVSQTRETARTLRVRQKVPMVALVGYTNAGKSTLFNRLTQAGVLEENKLFATLDTTLRKCSLPSGRMVLLCDTVGFIHKLPHQLVQAFRATLEEVCFADLLLHVVDSSDPKAQMEWQVTRKELEALGAGDKETICILNKSDLAEQAQTIVLGPVGGETVLRISALKESDQRRVLEAIDAALSRRECEYEVLIPYSEGKWTALLNKEATILEEEYRDEGTYLKVTSRPELRQRVRAFLMNDTEMEAEFER